MKNRVRVTAERTCEAQVGQMHEMVDGKTLSTDPQGDWGGPAILYREVVAL